jgi:hypothetical protein
VFEFGAVGGNRLEVFSHADDHIDIPRRTPNSLRRNTGDNAGFVSRLVWAPRRDTRVALLAPDEIDLQAIAMPALAALLAPT